MKNELTKKIEEFIKKELKERNVKITALSICQLTPVPEFKVKVINEEGNMHSFDCSSNVNMYNLLDILSECNDYDFSLTLNVLEYDLDNLGSHINDMKEINDKETKLEIESIVSDINRQHNIVRFKKKINFAPDHEEERKNYGDGKVAQFKKQKKDEDTFDM